MNLPSDEFKIDETNELLSLVPGLGFKAPIKKVVGGNRGKLNPETLQVEDTNAAVAEILGGGFVHDKLMEDRRPSRRLQNDLEEAANLLFIKRIDKEIIPKIQMAKKNLLSMGRFIAPNAREVDDLAVEIAEKMDKLIKLVKKARSFAKGNRK